VGKLMMTMQGPYNLRYVAFLAPDKPVKGPLHVQFQLSQWEDPRRFIDIMDAANQTVINAIQNRPANGGGSGYTRREAAQWLLDIACVRYGQEASALDAWI
jgi:hypothetical protein